MLRLLRNDKASEEESKQHNNKVSEEESKQCKDKASEENKALNENSVERPELSFKEKGKEQAASNRARRVRRAKQ